MNRKVLVFAGLAVLLVGLPLLGKYTGGPDAKEVEVTEVAAEAVRSSILSSGALAYREDVLGNAVIEYRRGRKTRPLVLGAHTDHPAFVVTQVKGRRIDLEFRGGVSGAYGKGEELKGAIREVSQTAYDFFSRLATATKYGAYIDPEEWKRH